MPGTPNKREGEGEERCRWWALKRQNKQHTCRHRRTVIFMHLRNGIRTAREEWMQGKGRAYIRRITCVEHPHVMDRDRFLESVRTSRDLSGPNQVSGVCRDCCNVLYARSTLMNRTGPHQISRACKRDGATCYTRDTLKQDVRPDHMSGVCKEGLAM